MSVQSAHNLRPVSHSGKGLRVGVFDSGVGGLSVLRAIRRQLPDADLIYVADSANAPYGERDEAFILQRSHDISVFLREQGVDGIVVACNTATAAAVHHLRQTWPDLPIVGVEPGIKPAIARSKNKRVGVLATRGTLASAKFTQLVARHGQDAHLVLQPCPGLAKAIESGDLNRPALLDLIDTYCQPLKEAGVDIVVLGCTHYPFIAPQLQKALGPDVTLLDTAEAVALQTAAVLCSRRNPETTQTSDQPSDSTDGANLNKKSANTSAGHTQLWTTGAPIHLQQLARSWLGWQVSASLMPSA